MTASGSLLPREHGAYAELAFPLVTGLGLATPTVGTFAVAVGAFALFLVHEPLAISLGFRGARLQSQRGNRARIRVLALSALAVVSLIVGVRAAGSLLWPSLAFPLAPLLLLGPLMLLGRQKTLLGEILVITVFAATVFPLGATSGVPPSRILGASAVWWISFVLGTLEVHAIKATHKGGDRSRWTRWGSPVAAGATSLFCIVAAAGPLAAVRVPALALLPPALGTLALSVRRVHPRFLKRVGWALVGANTLSLIILLVFG
ncbi:MAG: YwiC-like family protein [Gemmatimonadetes bacterium]|nr:YwiC-like family protein [Gemmatimonadota bacterium]